MTRKLRKQTPAVKPAETSLVGINLYHGPLPAASEFAAYEQAHPGAADRILSLAERDQRAVIQQRWFQQRSDFLLDLLVQGFLYGLVAAAVYLAIHDKPLEAFFAGLAPIAIAIYANTRKPHDD